MKIEKWKRAARSAGYRKVRKVVVLVLGVLILAAAGVVLIFIPGPAVVVIPAGVAILATEFPWARAWVRKVQNWLIRARAKTKAALSVKHH